MSTNRSNLSTGNPSRSKSTQHTRYHIESITTAGDPPLNSDDGQIKALRRDIEASQSEGRRGGVQLNVRFGLIWLAAWS